MNLDMIETFDGLVQDVKHSKKALESWAVCHIRGKDCNKIPSGLYKGRRGRVKSVQVSYFGGLRVIMEVYNLYKPNQLLVGVEVPLNVTEVPEFFMVLD